MKGQAAALSEFIMSITVVRIASSLLDPGRDCNRLFATPIASQRCAAQHFGGHWTVPFQEVAFRAV
jgi:hypothetical protein